MNLQISLRKEPVKPWADVCCEACWMAKLDRCVCRCKGQYHGIGRPEASKNEEKEEVTA